MIITRSPFRVSLFGGGTDFRSFYSKKNAYIVSFSIDKYCYVTLRRLLPYFGANYRVSWSQIEEKTTINSISHPSVRACLAYKQCDSGLEIHTVGDLPARSGLGSSSSFTCALLSAISLYQNISYSKSSIAKEAIYVEQSILKENVGVQDQIQASHGGFNITTIFADSSYSILSLDQTSPLVYKIDQYLMLVYTGITRTSSDIQNNLQSSNLNESRIKSLEKINDLAKSFSEKLMRHDAGFDYFLAMLTMSWEAKLQVFCRDQTTEKIISIYDKAMSSGALSGKLLGAGGGGFFAFFVPPNSQEHFCAVMKPYIAIKASISYTGIEQIL